MSHLADLRQAADGFVLQLLVPLGIYLLFSGLDDLFIDMVWLCFTVRGKLFWKPRVVLPSERKLVSSPEQRIAIFVPLWHEAEVIGGMLTHNVAAIRYHHYDFFVGAYPNDSATIAAVRASEARFANVHLAVCPHDGPTSKADCLNWIYQRMLLFEEANGAKFDVVMTHDAEDLIHPESLRWVNHFAGEFGFVQIPVLALSTPLLNVAHGIYCDEFAEFQTRDLPVRNFMGAFVPSAGVGTAYTRTALEALAESSSNRIFEPGSLTEDYENGFRLHALGFKQVFVPITRRNSFIATREFFPRKLAAAIRQRTRWVTGIALQGWENHGWHGRPGQLYWLWRDRKGLIANPISLLTNLVCGYALASGLWSRVTLPGYVARILAVTFALQILRTAIRIGCAARVYGIVFGMLAPLRAVVANYVNALAAFKAVYRYTRAKMRGEQLVWVKTEHAYPSRMALMVEKRLLGEILVGSGYLEQDVLDRALASQPANMRIGEYLVSLGELTEDDLYEALSLQQELPLAVVRAPGIPARVARALPAQVAEKWNVLPFRIEEGYLDIAGPELPAETMEIALKSHTSLRIRFHLITPLEYGKLKLKAAAA